MWSLDVYAVGNPPAVAIITIISSWILCVTGIVVAGRRARQRAALAAGAEASIGEARRLAEGDIVLSGIVRHLEDHDVAVKVKISQEGRETESSGSWSHSWTEVDREIIVAPFVLELSTGEHVRVVPPKNVDVADALDQKVWIDHNRRMLSAELVPGEQIYARGRLERSDVALPGSAYRDNAWGWELRAADGQMLLSSEPLGAGLRERARFHRKYAWVATAMFIALQISLLWFYARAIGDTVAVEVASKHSYLTTDSEGDTEEHYVIDFAQPTLKSVNISQDDYERIGPKDKVPIRRASLTNWNLGASPTLRFPHTAILFFPPIAFWILYLIRRRASRPWFRRKVNESSSGRLSDAR